MLRDDVRLPLLFTALALCALTAIVGGAVTASAVDGWYLTLDKPPWTPPGWAFGPIWTTLYVLMALAVWDVGRRAPERRDLIALWGLQLALNAAWSPIFFGAKATGVALVVIVAMWAAIAACIWRFREVSGRAAGALVPYLLWVSIATTLNAWIVAYNG